MSGWTIETIPGFCVTLERRPDRWKRFQDQYGIKQLPKLRRFPGVDGNTIDIRNDSRIALLAKRNIILKQRRAHEELDSPGGVGCALSHIALWQWLVSSNEQLLLVMEDDAVVPPNFKEQANELIRHSPNLRDPTKWDLWLIGAEWAVTTPLEEGLRTKVVRPYSFFMTHCYVITRQYAQRLLDDALPVTSHIDLWMSNYAAIHKTRMIASDRLKLKQYQRAKTDIQINENRSPVCDVPTNYTATHTLITNSELMLARAAEVTCAIGLGYLAFNYLRKYV